MALKNVCLLLLAVVTVTLAAFDSINKVINNYYYLNHTFAQTSVQDRDFKLGIRDIHMFPAVFRIRSIRMFLGLLDLHPIRKLFVRIR
jgi:hypothetical protein